MCSSDLLQAQLAGQHQLRESGLAEKARLVQAADIALGAGMDLDRRDVHLHDAHVLHDQCIHAGVMELMDQLACRLQFGIMQYGVERDEHPCMVTVGKGHQRGDVGDADRRRQHDDHRDDKSQTQGLGGQVGWPEQAGERPLAAKVTDRRPQAPAHGQGDKSDGNKLDRQGEGVALQAVGDRIRRQVRRAFFAVVIAVAAAFAEGETRLEGLGELRVKESDRLDAIARGLAAAGADVAETEDSLTIRGTGGVAGGARIEAAEDHRIAMAFLVLGAVTEPPVEIDDGATIDTSFPGFAGLMNGLGADISPPGGKADG